MKRAAGWQRAGGANGAGHCRLSIGGSTTLQVAAVLTYIRNKLGEMRPDLSRQSTCGEPARRAGPSRLEINPYWL